jgi:hypothetical protein
LTLLFKKISEILIFSFTKWTYSAIYSLKIDRLRGIWWKMKMQNAWKGLSLSFTIFQHPATALKQGVKNAKAFTRILSEAPNEISLEATKADAVHVSARAMPMAEHTTLCLSARHRHRRRSEMQIVRR